MTEFAEKEFNSRDYLPTDDYIRLDEDFFLKHPTLMNGNAFHDTLRGDGMVLTYEVYQKKGSEEIAAVIKFGHRLNGHKGIVHGGIISTAFDNSFGWLFFTFDTYPAFTANLSVNFRKPLYENSTVILRAKIDNKTVSNRHFLIFPHNMILGSQDLYECCIGKPEWRIVC